MILEVLHFIFSSFWTWAGFTLTGALFLLAIFGSIGEGLKRNERKGD